MKPTLKAEHSEWPEVLATVTECKYDFGAGRALAFGIPTSKHFLIRYNYFANGEFHNGEFASATPIPQGHLFPIRYHPDAPHQHNHELSTAPNRRGAILIIGVVSSFVLSLVVFATLRGCH